MLSAVGFILMILLMVVLIKGWVAPPIAFILMPLIACVILAVAGVKIPSATPDGAAVAIGVKQIGGFISSGMKTMLSTTVLFVFSISYFTLMNEVGLFDPIIGAITKIGKTPLLLVFAIVFTTFIAHMDGSGATTYLIVCPAFLPILKKMGFRPQALLAIMCGSMAALNIMPWGGPTMRAASVAGTDTGTLYSFIMPSAITLIIYAFVNGFLVYLYEKIRGLKPQSIEEAAAEDTAKNDKGPKTWKYYFNLAITVIMLVFLFMDTPMPLYSLFMIAYAIVLIVNFRDPKLQNKKIKELGINAMVMTVTLLAVGVFMGVISGSGMVKAMAGSIVNVLPDAMRPHMHWFMALFAVPMLMILGTDAYYYAFLPIIMGMVEPFGIPKEVVAATLLLTGTCATFCSPSVAAVYVGLGITDVSIGEHIKYSLKFCWFESILILVISTILGVVKF